MSFEAQNAMDRWTLLHIIHALRLQAGGGNITSEVIFIANIYTSYTEKLKDVSRESLTPCCLFLMSFGSRVLRNLYFHKFFSTLPSGRHYLCAYSVITNSTMSYINVCIPDLQFALISTECTKLAPINRKSLEMFPWSAIRDCLFISAYISRLSRLHIYVFYLYLLVIRPVALIIRNIIKSFDIWSTLITRIKFLWFSSYIALILCPHAFLCNFFHFLLNQYMCKFLIDSIFFSNSNWMYVIINDVILTASLHQYIILVIITD